MGKTFKTVNNKSFERTRCDDGALPVTVVARAAQWQRYLEIHPVNKFNS